MSNSDAIPPPILISRVVWENLVLPLDRSSRAMLWTLHSNDVGAPPEVCGSLSRYVRAPETAMLHTMWVPITMRLALSAQKHFFSLNSKPEKVSDVIERGLQASWHTAVSRFALPVLRLVCQRLGRNYLFCEEDVITEVTAQSYGEYQRAFVEKLKKLADPSDAVSASFWDALALQFVTLALRSSDADIMRSSVSVPQAAAFLRLEPEVTRAQRDNPPVLQLAKRFWLVDPRRGDPGVDGVRHSRNESDLPRILPSEFMNPPMLLADRLANEGVLVFHRPPRPVRRREFLIVGIMPPQVATSAVAPFLRACWLEFMSRAHRVLASSGHLRSELRYIEATDQAHMRTLALYAGDLGAQARVPMAVSNPLLHRSQLGSLSGFLPILGDTHAMADAVRLPLGEHAGVDETSQWPIAAWSAQRDHSGWQGGVTFLDGRGTRDIHPTEPLRVDKFSFVWVLLFLPPHEVEDQAGVDLLRNPLRWVSVLRPSPTAVCLCQVPDSSAESGTWRLSGRDGHEEVPPGNNKMKYSPNAIASDLLKHWTTDLVKGARDE